MKEVIEKYFCDICKKETNNITTKTIQVIFQTEQTEGRNCKPYLSNVNLDICPECFKKILNGKAVLAWGAQGYNEYKINE